MASKPSALTQLISRVGHFRDKEWVPGVRRRTELCLIDSLSCFSAGCSLDHFMPSATVAARLLDSEGDSRAGLSPFALAYLYGQAANALDYDDTLLGHPGSPIVGAILSVGKRERLSVDQLLRGIAAAYEAHFLLSAAAFPSPERSAYVRSVGVWDTVAASVGVCIALGLEDWLVERTVGIAVSHSVLPYTAKWYERPVPALKNNLGWVAAGAVLSVELAIAGQSGVTNALDGDTGMWRMAGSDRWNLDPSLQEIPAVLRTGFKHFPACWHLQEYLKALSSLLESLPQDDDVVEITASGPPEIEKFCHSKISGPADIAFSLPATCGLLISGIEPGAKWTYMDHQSGDQHHREKFRYQGSGKKAISVRTRSGAEFNGAVAVGDYFNPASVGLDENGVVSKHERLARGLLGAETVALARRDLKSLDEVPFGLYDSIERMMRPKAVISGAIRQPIVARR